MSSSSEDVSTDPPPTLPPNSNMPIDKGRTKKWAPKTFNGCLTCKKRRIKCDEGKPSCQRCIKSNIKCSGYAPPKIRLFEPATLLGSTVPPTQPPTIASTSASTAMPDIPQFQTYLDTYPHPHTLALVPSFGTDDEYRSFQFFLEKTSDLISVYSQPYLWTVLLPQATWHQPAIKHSIIALATLHQSLTSFDPGAAARENHSFMSHYNMAIRALVTDKPPVDVVLAACVIFWALENFNGSGQAAFDHMKAAIKILGEWKAKRRPNDPANDLISTYIEPTIRDGIKFASRDRVEELQNQMESLSMTTQDFRVLNIDHPAFDTLEKAGHYLKDCIEQLLDLTLTLQSPALSDQIQELDARLYKWMNLFQDLTATGPVYQRRMLVVHNVVAYCLLSRLKLKADIADMAATPPGRDRYSFIVLEVEDMLRNDPYCVESSRKRPPILGFIPPVFLAASAAPKAETRQRAINALRLLNNMEGSWNGEVAASIAEVLLEIAQQFSIPAYELDIEQMSFEFNLEKCRLCLTWQPDDEHLQGFNFVKELQITGIDWSDCQKLPELIQRFGYRF